MTQVTSPWKTKGSRFVYENPWIHVREDDVVQPDGKPGIYGVVHFKNTAIGVLPIDEDDKICLVGQYRYAIERYSWEIPEGGCAEGEDYLDAAKRELIEETGMVASDWTRLGCSHLSNSVSDELAIFYLATGLTRGTPNPEGTEELAYKHVTFDQALDMVMQGEITDALSILAITHYGILRLSNKV
ncbi:MAG: NUDIX hydrolase [Cyanobacteria bacterium SZAS-4]|nr:NUDIX hydrolase [Cyanobacteria bacterium SZAS-4]